MIRIVFLVSSNGGTLKFLNEYFKVYSIKELSISSVIGDRPCGAIEYAKNNNIPSKIIKYNEEDRETLKAVLTELNPDIIVTNIFKILDTNIVNAFKGKLINFHYSLLPSFKGHIGIETINEARKLNCQFIGSTCHLVDEKVDNGQIIGQLCFQLKPTISDKQYISTMFRSNCLLALNILLSMSSDYDYKDSFVELLDSLVHFSPCLHSDIILPKEEFWKLIQLL